MNKKDILKNVTRELRLVYYNDYLLKCGAITRREHRMLKSLTVPYPLLSFPPKNRQAIACLFFYPLRKQWHIINDSVAIVASHQSVRTVYHHA